MRLLLTSDHHYRLPALDWLCRVGADHDAVVLAGDLLNVAGAVPIEAQIVVVQSYLNRLAAVTRVFAVSGNHDLDGPGEHGEQVSSWLRRLRPALLHTDGQTVDVGSVRITLCPWWDGPVTRDAVAAQLDAASEDRPDLWIWVYHAPPAGTPLCSDGRRSFPDHELAGWIDRYQPDFVLCGHIHQAPWAAGGSWHATLGRTKIFNAGHMPVPVPPHIAIDTVVGTAVWTGISGEEVERLKFSVAGRSTTGQPSGSRAEPA